jgi:citronellol/citronellal dehydrogenase
MDLEGKVALVTGASRGVGAATAVALAQQGCDVACAARSTTDAPQRTPGTLEETAARVEAAGGRSLVVPTNLADEHDVVAMVRTTEEALGRVDILVNNAAITFVGDLDIPLKRHDLVMEVNLRAPLIACREVVPGMKARGGGAILNVSSNAALFPHPGIMSYGISKIGLERLTVDRSTWEPPEVAAEGIVWMLRQPPSYSGRRESMYVLRDREGIMASRAAVRPAGPHPVTELFDGLAPPTETTFREPYPDQPKET